MDNMSVPVYLQNHRLTWAVERANHFFDRRVQQIDSELADARILLACLSMKEQVIDYDHSLALCMAHHHRLGENSIVASLPQELLQLIFDQSGNTA